MGLACVVIKMPKWISIIFLLNQQITLALTLLGLLKRREQASSEQHPTNYVLLMDGLSPSPVPVPIYVVTSLIKKRLPVVKYGKVLERLEVREENNMACAVCLDCIEKRQEIRELCNCSHVFHRECLDRWMDEDQVTCPLCRAMLYTAPANGDKGCKGNSLMAEIRDCLTMIMLWKGYDSNILFCL